MVAVSLHLEMYEVAAFRTEATESAESLPLGCVCTQKWRLLSTGPVLDLFSLAFSS